NAIYLSILVSITSVVSSILTSFALPTLCRLCAIDLSNTFPNKLPGLTS
ncbi:17727_t:CDS:1, partial [Cetraspora pellucida]